jgi:hypothetical protein
MLFMISKLPIITSKTRPSAVKPSTVLAASGFDHNPGLILRLHLHPKSHRNGGSMGLDQFAKFNPLRSTYKMFPVRFRSQPTAGNAASKHL